MKRRRILLLLLLLGLAGFLGYAWLEQSTRAPRIIVERDALDTPSPHAPEVQSGHDPYFAQVNHTITGVRLGTNASVALTK